ncbi:hypothetical protein KCP77_15310 [Salmonella enterica subsp. enterica]|nr:hypothetical protein KCP77_15310 [Salmonella enterica subsp. enterica]
MEAAIAPAPKPVSRSSRPEAANLPSDSIAQSRSGSGHRRAKPASRAAGRKRTCRTVPTHKPRLLRRSPAFRQKSSTAAGS